MTLITHQLSVVFFGPAVDYSTILSATFGTVLTQVSLFHPDLVISARKLQYIDILL